MRVCGCVGDDADGDERGIADDERNDRRVPRHEEVFLARNERENVAGRIDIDGGAPLRRNVEGDSLCGNELESIRAQVPVVKDENAARDEPVTPREDVIGPDTRELVR